MKRRTRRSRFTRIAFLAITTLLSMMLHAQDVRAPQSPERIKSAFLIGFLEYFTWNDSARQNAYTIGIVGNTDNVFAESETEDIFEILQTESISRFVNGRPIIVQRANDQQAMRSSNILYVSQVSDYTLQEISVITSGSGTLIVSENQSDKTHSMINFLVKENNTMTFEINKPNIDFENLEMDMDILLLGGTELDVASLFRAMEIEVLNTRQRLEQIEQEALKIQAEFENEIEQKQSIIDDQTNEILEQSNTLDNNSFQLNEILAELNNAKNELQINQNQLAVSNTNLLSQLAELEDKNAQLNLQASLVDENKLLLQRQQEEISEQEARLQSQRSEVDQQSIVIESYLFWIQAGTVALIIFVVLVSMVLLINRKRTQANKLLAHQNIELEDAQEAFQRERDRADKANQAKGMFLANLSHEIRSPMNAILGFSELLQIEETANQNQINYLDAIQRNGQHLLTLINDVLDMSKIEAGKIEIKIDHVDLFHLLDDIDTMFRGRIDEAGIKFTLRLAPGVPQYIKTDEGKIRQILVNLLSNAVKFTKSGEIQFNIYGKENSNGSKENKSYKLSFEIIDTGQGIDNKDIGVIFEAFEQSSNTDASIQGTGLGLAISRNFARLLGGDIWVQSTIGSGSTFCCTITAEIVSKVIISRPLNAGTITSYKGDKGQYKILVVDDRYENRELLIQILSSLDFLIEQAVNGEQAVAIYERWEPDLILMDLRMPVMDGKEATQIIKAKPRGKYCKIICVSANAFEEQRQEILDAGASAFIRKPFRKEMILTEIAAQLNLEYIYAEKGQIKSESP